MYVFVATSMLATRVPQITVFYLPTPDTAFRLRSMKLLITYASRYFLVCQHFLQHSVLKHSVLEVCGPHGNYIKIYAFYDSAVYRLMVSPDGFVSVHLLLCIVSFSPIENLPHHHTHERSN